jgi:hypothetical protein
MGEIMRVKNEDTGEEFDVKCELSDRQKTVLLKGGLINYLRLKK